ncbi:MAG TPA: DUF3175 domain-containing protein [Dongiaceae bacterium]|nr:DUF3175 domain-containing protein [Dongiaceae bacterium]
MAAQRKTTGRKTAKRKTARRKTAGRKAASRWSARVTKRSDALDLEKSVFKSSDPHRIALSLKRSAERSKRRRGTPYQSAMSMLNFYINRAGRGLPRRKVQVLERAKGELRKAFGRD